MEGCSVNVLKPRASPGIPVSSSEFVILKNIKNMFLGSEENSVILLRISIFVLTVGLVAVVPAHSSELSNLDKIIDSLRVEWSVPGTSVAVVKDGEVIYVQGFGYRDIDHKLPFTPNTLLRVASTTKSFTSALVGTFVDEGVVKWDQPVKDYYPEFQMVDPTATTQTTFEDMLCHRTGLPMQENLLAIGVGRELTGSPRGYRENLLRRLRHFEPSESFRSRWQYQDLMLTCVGGILEWLTNSNYEIMLTNRLLTPLGMHASTFSQKQAREAGEFSECYAEVDNRIELMEHIDVSYIAPSAGLYSNAREMIRWVQFNIDQGNIDGQQLVSKESMEWIHRSHMIRNSKGAREFHKSAVWDYAHGWVRIQHMGQPLLTHGGSFNGHRTTMLFMPDKDIGVVVVCNLNLTLFDYMISRIVLDHFLGVDSAENWIEHIEAIQKKDREYASAEVERFLAGRQPQNLPEHELGAYAGVYSHPGYGTFVIENTKEGLVQTYDGRSFPVTPYDGEKFETRFQSTEHSLLYLTIEFSSGINGSVVALNVSLIPDLPPQRFVRE